MEKKNSWDQTHRGAIKNRLTIWALSLTLAANTPKVFAQAQQTKHELAKNMNNLKEDTIKAQFISVFSSMVSTINTISDFPLKVKFKDRNLVNTHHFPEYIDIQPKMIKKPEELLILTLWDKVYKITPYKGIKIKTMELVDNKNDLNANKAILWLQFIGFLPWNITISCKELAEYMYNLSRLPVGNKQSLWWIHVEVLSRSTKTRNTKQMTDTPNFEEGQSLANKDKDK